METEFVKNTSILSAIVLAIICSIFSVDAARYCRGEGLTFPNGTRLCPPGSAYDSEIRKCCKDTPFSGQTAVSGRLYTSGEYSSCYPALKLKDGSGWRCPRGGRFVAGEGRCCFPAGTTLDNYPGETGSGSFNCIDKRKANGQPSDCPANKDKCNDPMWYALMTEQCPRTCGRCGQRLGGCVDGMNQRGRSECAASRDLCTHPGYSEFMRLECPRTCGYCGQRAGAFYPY